MMIIITNKEKIFIIFRYCTLFSIFVPLQPQIEDNILK